MREEDEELRTMSFSSVASFCSRRRISGAFLSNAIVSDPVRNASICWNIYHGCEICGGQMS